MYCWYTRWFSVIYSVIFPHFYFSPFCSAVLIKILSFQCSFYSMRGICLLLRSLIKIMKPSRSLLINVFVDTNKWKAGVALCFSRKKKSSEYNLLFSRFFKLDVITFWNHFKEMTLKMTIDYHQSLLMRAKNSFDEYFLFFHLFVYLKHNHIFLKRFKNQCTQNLYCFKLNKNVKTDWVTHISSVYENYWFFFYCDST